YVSDPAVTRHLNAFLEPTGQAPDAILFNGGFFIPEILRDRVADVVGQWYDRRPEILENSELDLAVARGGAYYSYVRSPGSGVPEEQPQPHRHAPLNAVIRLGKKAEEKWIPGQLGARLTEIGTLETWCESKISDNRWRLQCELRKATAAQPAERKAAAVVTGQ